MKRNDYLIIGIVCIITSVLTFGILASIPTSEAVLQEKTIEVKEERQVTDQQLLSMISSLRSEVVKLKGETTKLEARNNDLENSLSNAWDIIDGLQSDVVINDFTVEILNLESIVNGLRNKVEYSTYQEQIDALEFKLNELVKSLVLED